MTEFLIGADPELFVRDSNGELISAYGMIPGTKANPFKVEGGAVQVDGMALEFNINPAATFKEFDKNITNVLKQLKEMIPNGYTFDFSPVAEFGKEYIDAQPDEAKELGCDPDYNAYTGRVNDKPDASQGIRTASGHIHIGWTLDQDITDLDHIEACHMVSKQLDVTLGLTSFIWDRDTRRSTMYGKLGTYRPKHYGVEYRTMSNVWVNDVRARALVFDIATRSVDKLLSGRQFYNDMSAPDYEYLHQNGNYSDLFYHVSSSLARNLGIYPDDLTALYKENQKNPFQQAVVKEKKKFIAGWDLAPMKKVAGIAPWPINNAILDLEVVDDFEPIPAFHEDDEEL